MKIKTNIKDKHTRQKQADTSAKPLSLPQAFVLDPLMIENAWNTLHKISLEPQYQNKPCMAKLKKTYAMAQHFIDLFYHPRLILGDDPLLTQENQTCHI